ncbi:MAG: NACHT domain-containing protein [Xenococcaceae cyanobacterium MO_167.B52]|nr:NACHT domain-containing protein [Xenococcaceae cyanobacterium MO_167.B52]
MKPEDLLKLVDIIKNLISEMFFQGKELPVWLILTINIILLAIFVLLAIWVVLFVLSKIKNSFIEEFWPLFYNQEQRRHRLKRQLFADYIESEIRNLNSREEWKDYRFTELEAEIEAEGRRKGLSLIPFFYSTQRGLRREQSLSKALELSSERLILVEGDPGSGKSVALRHVARKLAKSAMKSRRVKSVIPLYINLKKLERSSEEPIDRNLIESFVKKELNRINDRDIEEFLDNEFDIGLKQKTWLFLFDSFDELPEVLSSVEADEFTRSYAEAIDDFLGGFNKCQGIIASRQFRGPKHLGWPRFRILPLEDRRQELIRKAQLDLPIEKELISQLRNASQEIHEMTKNPMFLGILCENMRDGSPFPQNTHSIFESYLEKRLTRDQDRLKKRFNLEPSAVRTMAEKVAFCMSLDPNLGLSPTRAEIRNAMSNLEFRVPGNFDQFLNALEYLKLARSEDETIAGDSPLFTFSHRRFQEYFGTCVVLRDLNRINPRQLLTDGRWRETTVVIFQTQEPENFAPILAEARDLLDKVRASITGLIDDPIEYVNRESFEQSSSAPKNFSWSPGLLNLLGLLQDGFISRMNDLPDDIQMQAGRLLLSASTKGNLFDKKWSLEVAGITPQPVLLWLLRNAFSSESQWLKEVAYRQAARLSKIPDDISADIRRALLSLFSTNRLRKEFFATSAHLSRLDQSSKYLSVLRLLKCINPFDICLHIGSLIFLLYLSRTFLLPISVPVAIVFILILLWTYSSSLRIFSSVVSSTRFSFEQRRNQGSSILFDITRFMTPGSALAVYPRLIIFPLLWSIFAILAANTGRFTHPLWWLFLFLFPLLYFILKSKNFIKISISILGNVWTYVIISIISGYLFFIYAIIWINNLIFKNPDTILARIVFVIYGILVLASLFSLLRSWFIFLDNWFRDWMKLKKWIQSRPATMTAQKLLNLIDSYHNKGFSKQLIIISRERNLLPANNDSENLLNELAMALEHSLFLVNRKTYIRQRAWQRLKSKKQKTSRKILKYFGGIPKILSQGLKFSRKSKKSHIERIIENYSGSDFFTSWLKQYTRKDKKRFINLGSEFLDEIYILLEQIRAKRLVSEGSE